MDSSPERSVGPQPDLFKRLVHLSRIGRPSQPERLTRIDGYPGDMPVSTFAWVTSLLFGVMLGWGLVREPDDRTIAIWSTLLLTGIGAVVWLTGPAPDTDGALAAVGMTFSGATAAVVTFVASARRSA